MNIQELTGNTQQHLVESQYQLVHKDAVAPLQNLIVHAQQAGFELTVASGYRNFERQLAIWNNKFNGLRPVYDRHQNIVDLSSLSAWQKVQAIMLYSAIPGTSRHHWGTDFDVYDNNAVDEHYQLQLSPSEFQANGPFYELSLWLKNQAKSFGFYFPYQQTNKFNKGVADEPWHISYFPVASQYVKSLSLKQTELMLFIQDSEILGKQAIVDNFDLVLTDYLLNIAEV